MVGHGWVLLKTPPYKHATVFMYPLLIAHWEKMGSQNGSILEPFWKTVPLSRVEPFFSLNNRLDKHSSTGEGGTKIVPGVELSYVLWNGSRGGAILAPFFFSVLLAGYLCSHFPTGTRLLHTSLTNSLQAIECYKDITHFLWVIRCCWDITQYCSTCHNV